jgi:hypothetical protein
MSLLAAKNRTIRLTLENDLEAGTVKTPSRSFVDKFLPNSGLLGVASALISSSPTIELVGPTGIDFKISASIVDEAGLFSNFLEPYAIKNVPITIRGESYIGVYPGISRADKDISGVMEKFKKSLNSFSGRAGKAGTKERVLLEIENNPTNLRRFLGYITELSFGEDVKNPYVLPYTISFIGSMADSMQLVKGKNNARSALLMSGS